LVSTGLLVGLLPVRCPRWHDGQTIFFAVASNDVGMPYVELLSLRSRPSWPHALGHLAADAPWMSSAGSAEVIHVAARAVDLGLAGRAPLLGETGIGVAASPAHVRALRDRNQTLGGPEL